MEFLLNILVHGITRHFGVEISPFLMLCIILLSTAAVLLIINPEGIFPFDLMDPVTDALDSLPKLAQMPLYILIVAIIYCGLIYGFIFATIQLSMFAHCPATTGFTFCRV